MPDSYKLDHPNRKVSDKIFTREELNLPKNGFVFCSFNKTYKITPNVFDIWMKILKQVKGSVLWLLEDNPTATNNLKLEANKRNIDSARIIFAKRTKMSDHLARHKVADLFIDTLPYNAHTTASDGLWVGLPFLTLVGDTFASRVGASMLKAIGLPELITYSENEYKKFPHMINGVPSEYSRMTGLSLRLTFPLELTNFVPLLIIVYFKKSLVIPIV